MMSQYRHSTKKVRRLRGQSAHLHLPLKSVPLRSEKQYRHRFCFSLPAGLQNILTTSILSNNKNGRNKIRLLVSGECVGGEEPFSCFDFDGDSGTEVNGEENRDLLCS